MGLAVPGKTVEIVEKGGLHTAKVGFAIRILHDDEILETLNLLEQIVLLDKGIEETC